jgi:hypothetical protein
VLLISGQAALWECAMMFWSHHVVVVVVVVVVVLMGHRDD